MYTLRANIRITLPALAALVVANTPVARALDTQDTVHVVIVATTDVHGRVFHWDYVRDHEAPWGITRAATVVDSLRDRYPGRVVVVDAGDVIQGNPFAAYYATERPITPHPVIDALNAVGYDAATPGNHEFNWGLETLARAGASAAFPIVSGNIYRLPRDTLAYPLYTLLQRDSVRIGITGFTTPGTMVWDRANLAGRLVVRRIIPEAAGALERLRTAGADLRVVVIHSGLGGSSSYDTTGVGAENVAAALAHLPVKPHLVVVGHSHRTLTDSVIAGVHFVQPAAWAQTLAVAHVWLVREAGSGKGEAENPSIRPSADPAREVEYRVVRITAGQISLANVEPHAVITRRLSAAHDAVRLWVGAPLARVEGNWSARYARAQDTPIIDFVNEVQRRTTGAQLSSTAAFNVNAGFGPDEVRLRDVAGVYPYENTLKAVRIDGARLKAYLERSAAYFRTYSPGESVIDDNIPGFNFDILSGVEYVIDLTQPIGERIRQLTYQGRLIAPTDTFTLALNNYRQGGGGGFDMLRGLPVVYDRSESVRDLIMDYLRRVQAVAAADYFQPSWRIIPPDAEAAVREALAQRGQEQR